MVSAASTRTVPGGLSFIDLSNALAEASICTQGAQLMRWQPRSAAEAVLFESAALQYHVGKSLRGGIPVCWPWFGPHSSDAAKPSHGFVRGLVWAAAAPRELAGGETQLALALGDTEQTRALWPWQFRLECRFTVGESLGIELLTTNTGKEPFVIGEALHTYFRVADIGAISVSGLEGASYIDKVAAGARLRQTGAVRFTGETDRVYVGTDAQCVIVDPVLQRRILIDKEGSRSTVVWNPGPVKAGQLADLGAADDPQRRGGWRQLVCVESGNAAEDQVSVAPGETHRLAVRYRVEGL